MQKVKEQRIKEGQDYDTIIQKSRPDPIYTIWGIRERYPGSLQDESSKLE